MAAATGGTHLLVLAPGIGARTLATGGLPAATAAAPGGIVPLTTGLSDPIDLVAETFPAQELRDAGCQIDRRDLLLRPIWRSDEPSTELLQLRPLGPALLTVLELRGVLAAAALAGCGTRPVAQAMANLDHNINVARSRLRRGPPTKLWFAALGTPVAVAHMLDARALTRRIVGWPLGSSLRVRSCSHRAIVASSQRRAIDQLLERLPHSPLAGATSYDLGANGLLLLAPACSAFGRQRVFARMSHPHESRAAVAVPLLPRTIDRFDIPALIARVAMSAAASIPQPVTTPGHRRMPAAAAPGDGLLPLSAPVPALGPGDLRPGPGHLQPTAGRPDHEP